MVGTAKVRNSASSSARVMSQGNSRYDVRNTMRWQSACGSSRSISLRILMRFFMASPCCELQPHERRTDGLHIGAGKSIPIKGISQQRGGLLFYDVMTGSVHVLAIASFGLERLHADVQRCDDVIDGFPHAVCHFPSATHQNLSALLDQATQFFLVGVDPVLHVGAV